MASIVAQTLWRSLGVLSQAGAAQGAFRSSARAFATAAPTKKEVLYYLQNKDDAEASSAVKAYLDALYKGAKVEPSTAEQTFELTQKVEKKYMAAQAVETGIQGIAVPLSYDKEGLSSVKRYVAQLLALGKQAGFEDPVLEVEKKLTEVSATAESVKELITKSKSVMSADLQTALLEAVAQVEAASGGVVPLDGSSKAYKDFAKKVEGIATAHKFPWKALVDAKKAVGDEDAKDKLSKEYNAWFQSARVADAVAELDVLRAEATSLLDKQLGKTAEQVRKEQAAALQQAVKKAENAKGAPWAQQFLEDLKRVEWFDACVAENPAVGPKVKASA